MSPKGETSHRFSARCVTVLCMTLALLIGGELAVRARTLLQDPYIWHGPLFLYPPNTQAGDDPALTTNNKGFFGPPLEQPKPPDAYRVFLLGSSPLTNPEVPKAMQERLQELCPDRRIEVYSTGLPRYTSAHNALLMRELTGLDPDCLVLYMGMNDNVYNTNPGLRGLPPVGLWNWADLHRSLAFSMLWYYGYHKHFAVNPDFEAVRSEPIFADNIEDMVQQGLAQGADVVLVAMAAAQPPEDEALAAVIAANEKPMSHFWGNVGPSMKGLAAHRDAMQQIAEQHGIPFADPADRFSHTSEVFRDLCHFTSGGNRMLGQYFAEQVAPLAAADKRLPPSAPSE